MATRFAETLTAVIDRLVAWVVVPVTTVIAALAASGGLLAVFAALWLAFSVGLATGGGEVSSAWSSLGSLPLPLQAVVWLLFLPLVAGMWVWGTDWPLVVRLLVIGGIAAWNVLVLLPRRSPPAAA